MVRGNDSHAHKGALAARIPTLAEWGTGVDVVYPKENRKLAEASENSGTRVTARCAAEHNRDLSAMPGNATSKGSWTPNTLIKQGAKLVATWEHV
jgi:DNA processing protein